ncbi:hypothetical protein OPQ81_005358 [Rhizoctonia solani]|nr:hypothetical protein OPQ81_005358 [Rhizoctonia solani]
MLLNGGGERENYRARRCWSSGQATQRPELAWLGTESNQFGTDEFMQWLSALGGGKKERVEPYICLNMGTGTLDEALAWVEYCNGTKDTYYANLRRQNGHDGAVEQMTKENYARRGAVGKGAPPARSKPVPDPLRRDGPHLMRDHHVLKECVSVVDMHSIHIYTASPKHLPNVTAPLSAERAIQTAAALIDIARIENNVPPTKPQTTICFDEWNVWDPERAPGDKGAEEKYTLSDALAVAVWLNVFVRQSKYIGMANIAQTVNVISPLMTSRDGIVKQTTWWPLLLFSRFMRGWTVAAHVSCGSWSGGDEPGLAAGRIAGTGRRGWTSALWWTTRASSMWRW